MTDARISIACLLLCACASAPKPPLAFDHVIIFVSRDAPERGVLEGAGFRTAPGVNQHEGQGTASVTYEFSNAFLELAWPDERVPVSPALERAYEKFKLRSAWRTSGWSPFSFAMHRNGPPAPLPVPSWNATAPWMAPGTSIEILTPRDDTTSPSIGIHPGGVSEDPALDVSRRDLRAAGALNHPIGVKRVTLVRLITPPGYRPIDAVSYVQKLGVMDVVAGSEWTLELTFDGAAQGKSRDFRPDLPLRIRY
jgi:hypothetical protein